MSLVGTRPILQDELRQYELHHRARIAIKPGITGMWQVSGRSDITDLWSAALYQEADTIREATDAALELYEIVTGVHIINEMDRKGWEEKGTAY